MGCQEYYSLFFAPSPDRFTVDEAEHESLSPLD